MPFGSRPNIPGTLLQPIGRPPAAILRKAGLPTHTTCRDRIFTMLNRLRSRAALGGHRYRVAVGQPNVLDFHSLVLQLGQAPPAWSADLVVPWLQERPTIVAQLHDLGRPESLERQIASDETTVLAGLYALSRLVEIVLAPYEPTAEPWVVGEPSWSGPLPAVTVWPMLSSALGATPIAEDTFHPFFHEIVAVRAADDPDQPPELLSEVWPGALIRSLLLARAGVTVCAGANHLNPSVAATSCLYWAWWRRNRIVKDLSHGWGGSSQWNTDFRRDYVVDGVLHYNVDEAYQNNLSHTDAAADLSDDDRRDLLRFRHSVRRDLGNGQFPFYYSHVELRH